jgi:hypothetical protein
MSIPFTTKRFKGAAKKKERSDIVEISKKLDVQKKIHPSVKHIHTNLYDEILKEKNIISNVIKDEKRDKNKCNYNLSEVKEIIQMKDEQTKDFYNITLNTDISEKILTAINCKNIHFKYKDFSIGTVYCVENIAIISVHKYNPRIHKGGVLYPTVLRKFQIEIPFCENVCRWHNIFYYTDEWNIYCATFIDKLQYTAKTESNIKKICVSSYVYVLHENCINVYSHKLTFVDKINVVAKEIYIKDGLCVLVKENDETYVYDGIKEIDKNTKDITKNNDQLITYENDKFLVKYENRILFEIPLLNVKSWHWLDNWGICTNGMEIFYLC